MATRPTEPRNLLTRYWFISALIVVFLVALPGLLLHFLSLVGAENAVNRWLQDTFNLSYGVAVPWYGILLLLLLPLLILLLYFLKLKRRPLQVPSTFLWRKSIEDLHVNSLLQWLRQNVLLLLQLLVVVGLLYGTLNLRYHSRSGHGKHYILLIDNSASMSASDVAPTRLDWAKQQALQEIDAAGDEDAGMVIEFNDSARPVQTRTSDRELLRRAVRGIQPTERTTNITEALRLAESLANRLHSAENEVSRPEVETPGVERKYAEIVGTPTEVHIYSDGRFPDVEDFKLGNLKPLFHAAGLPGPKNVRNVAITACNASRDEKDPRKVRVFVGLKNYCPFAVGARVKMEMLVNGRRDAERDKPFEDVVSLNPLAEDTPGNGEVVFLLENLDNAAEVELHVHITDLRDKQGNTVADHFPLDDRAWLVLGVVRKARVLVVTDGNSVLRAFFAKNAGTQAIARVDFITSADLKGEKYLKPALNGAYDLVVFDRCGPAKEDEMPRANTFFIGYPPPPWKEKGNADDTHVVESVRQPHVKGWMARHALMNELTALHEIAIDEAFRMKDLPQHTPRLLEAGNDTPLLLTLNRGAFTDLVMTFPLFTRDGKWNTDWSVHHTSWPIFLANVLWTLGNVGDAVGEEPVRPGQVRAIWPDAAVDTIQVTPPGGGPHTVRRGHQPAFLWGDTEHVGIYTATWEGGGRRSFAVNLLDPQESNLEPRAALKIGQDKVDAGGTPGQPHEIWRWVVLGALALLVLEWYIYNRRISI